MAETFTPSTWLTGSGGGTPITAAELNRIEAGIESMDDRVTALEDTPASGLPEWVVYVDDYGATGNGSTDDSTAIIAARNAILNSRVSQYPTIPVLQFGPKTYRVVSPDALYPASTTQLNGYTIRGVHSNLSQIKFDPAGTSASLTDMNLITTTGSSPHLYGLRVEKIGFNSLNATASLAYFYSTAANWNQDMRFNEVEITGTWKRGLALDGDSTANLNSEVGFEYLNLEGATFSTAFFHSGITSPSTNVQQDQFLNYWVTKSKLHPVSGDLFLLERGGHLTVDQCSALMTGAAGGTFFKMTNIPTHADAVAKLAVSNVRFELRNANTRVIDCSWRDRSHVTFRNCDDNSHGSNYAIGSTGSNYDTHIYRTTATNEGPLVAYEDCALMGYHRVVTAGTIPTFFRLAYHRCHMKNFPAGGIATLAGATSQFIRHDSAAPKYRYQDCYNITDIAT